MKHAIPTLGFTSLIASLALFAAGSACSSGTTHSPKPSSNNGTPNGRAASPTPPALVISLSTDPQISYSPVVERFDRDALTQRDYLYVGGGAWNPMGRYLVRVDHRTGERIEIDSLEKLSRSIAPLMPSDAGVAVAAILASRDGYLQSYGGEDLHVDIGIYTMDVTLWHTSLFGCETGAVSRVTYRFALATAEFHAIEWLPAYVPTMPICSPRLTLCPCRTVTPCKWQYAVQRLKRRCSRRTPSPQPMGHSMIRLTVPSTAARTGAPT